MNKAQCEFQMAAAAGNCNPTVRQREYQRLARMRCAVAEKTRREWERAAAARCRKAGLGGFGAAELPPGTLSPEKVAAFQKGLKEAILTADKVIYDTQQQLPGAMDTFASGLENVLTLGYLKETKANILRSYASRVADWESRKKILWDIVGTGRIDGAVPTEKQVEGAFFMVSGSIKACNEAIATVNQYTKGTILTGAVAKVFGDIADAFSAAFDAVIAILKGLAKAAAGAGAAIGWLPWIVGGAIVLPLLLKTFSAYKRGGSAAAADEAAGQIERGRSAAASAVSSGARKLITRGMAGVKRRRFSED